MAQARSSNSLRSRGTAIARVVMAIALLPEAILFPWAGIRAIQAQSYDMPWRSSSGLVIGPIVFFGNSASGTEQYRGAAAIQMGVGLVASGMMFGIWTLSLFWSAVRRTTGTWSRVHTVVAVLSLGCLASATIAFFPPSHIGTTASSTALYAVLLLTCLVLLGHASTARARWRRWFFPFLIVTALVADHFSTGAAVGISMGLLVSLFAAAHVWMLVSKGCNTQQRGREL